MSEEHLRKNAKHFYDFLKAENEKNPDISFGTNSAFMSYNLSLPSEDRVNENRVRLWLKHFAECGLMKRKVKRPSPYSKLKSYLYHF